MVVEKKKQRKIEIPTCSMADIAFLLLTFFLLTTTIDVDKGIGLTLPGKGQTKEVKKKNIANLLINAQGEVMLDDQQVEIPRIKDILKRKLIDNVHLLVSVKTDRETPYRIYVKVLDQIKLGYASAGIEPRISIAEPEAS